MVSSVIKKNLKNKIKSMAKDKLKKRIKTKPQKKVEKTFASEMRELNKMAMTDAARQAAAIRIAKKYGMPIKIAGKTFGPKKGSYTSERIPGVKRNKQGRIIDKSGS